MRKILTAVAASLATVMAMTACGSDPATPGADATLDPANPTKVVVGASPVPHAKILEFVKENLAAEAGIELEIQEFDDYVLPNEALASGELDANYFQHVPYFDNQVAEKGFEFEHGEGVHIEPFALFSDRHESADQVPDGGVIALTNDPSNQYRGLKLLEEAGLLQDIAEDTTALTISDEQNPKGLKFEEAQPEVVVQQLEDPKVDAALINGNFILNAGLNADDAIAVEAVEGNPYANILAWRTDNTNPGVAKLDELLHSDEVAEFIKQEWPAGDVIPG
ncbi:MetQ/NlpA family ABC transporter substrate-binding protein [Tessaracoccus sp. MC1756]|uniref:MetQ/NlpA family ABC transporter substrate-binding protein n=1 Tax=Tessaracoccus sp. MC1756 TaxID=2760311 RepID=UPI0015FF0A14|nr:MetQ/NlpA family ABC transporter substrate-binding protein [Tessaracoccus sp. MC1756]MBB1508356.1 ABC transporter [Tessaracoccus sp. MC1756]